MLNTGEQAMLRDRLSWSLDSVSENGAQTDLTCTQKTVSHNSVQHDFNCLSQKCVG